MRYYEIAQRPKIPTTTDQIMRDERHLKHDAGQIWPIGGCLRVQGSAARGKSQTASEASRHAPVLHPGRSRRVR